MEAVPIHGPEGVPVAHGVGLYARALMQCLPELPVEAEGRLMDPALRENFIERVFIYHRWQQLGPDLTPQSLIEFHTRYKLVLLAHDEQAYRRLGRWIGDSSGKLGEQGAYYIRQLMQSLKKPATRSRHANVLQHALGFLKRRLEPADKAEMLMVIDRYRLGEVSWIVPITMLQQHLRRFPQSYLEEQYYFAPHPDELMLRNLV